MRGAHRGVWCSKSTPLIEAELFAAERKRPAPDGRALSCAAPYARKIQGLTASQNLPDARNRAPVTPVSLRDRRESQRKGRSGESRGDRKPYLVSCPLLFPPVNTGTPGRRRRPLHTLTLSVNLASSGAPLYRRRLCHLLQIKQINIYAMLHIGRCANRESRFSSKNVAFSLALCAQYTV